MSGKFAVALLVLFCVGQVYPASLPKSLSVSHNENTARNAVNDVIHQLNILISRIGQGIGELGSLIGELERRVAETIAEVNLPQIITDLRKQIENIFQEAGVTGSEAVDCLNEARTSISTLEKTIDSGVRQCLQPIRPAREHLQEQISDISSQGKAIISSISSGIGSCYKENPIRPLECLRDLEESATSSTNALTSRIGEAIGEDKEMINNLVEELIPCVQAVAEEANNQQEAIVTSFRVCLWLIN